MHWFLDLNVTLRLFLGRSLGSSSEMDVEYYSSLTCRGHEPTNCCRLTRFIILHWLSHSVNHWYSAPSPPRPHIWAFAWPIYLLPSHPALPPFSLTAPPLSSKSLSTFSPLPSPVLSKILTSLNNLSQAVALIKWRPRSAQACWHTHTLTHARASSVS